MEVSPAPFNLVVDRLSVCYFVQSFPLNLVMWKVRQFIYIVPFD